MRRPGLGIGVALVALGALSLVEASRLRDAWHGPRLMPLVIGLALAARRRAPRRAAAARDQDGNPEVVLARLFAPTLGAALLSVAVLVAPTVVSAQYSPDLDMSEYLWAAPPEPAAKDLPPGSFPWAVTLYGGPFTKQDFLEFFTERVEFDHAAMVSVAVSRKVAVLWKHIRWEVEFGVSKWFGDQTNWEFTSAIVARWTTFPWNDYVNTTIAVGDGPSFATEPPKLEKKNFDAAKRLQNYVFLELTFGLPRYPQWDFVIRIHHRSGVFGTLGGSGSSVPALGIKYKF